MRKIPCPYLKADVDLTVERERHITFHHPDLLPEQKPRIFNTLGKPDQVRRSGRMRNTYLFSRWFDDLRGGKHVVVVVVVSNVETPHRCWIITAYIARKLTGGQIEWKRD